MKIETKCDVEGCEDGFVPVQDGPDDFLWVECLNPIHNAMSVDELINHLGTVTGVTL